jgi:hypothetical protein
MTTPKAPKPINFSDIAYPSTSADSNVSSEEDNDDDFLNQILHKDSLNDKSFYRVLDKQKQKTILKSMNITTETQFTNHLQLKLDKLSQRLKILQIKYIGYKKWYDNCNISIIIVSALLSVFEAFRNEIMDHIGDNNAGSLLFNMIPIAVSTSITCSAAIIKFKKYQEKMENMQFTREKVILAISKIKRIQELLWFSKKKDFESIKQKYVDDIYGFYNESTSELERHIKYSDHSKLNDLK